MASPSTSTWHTVNPQTRPLTLNILELTPLALTLSLTLSPLTSSHHTPTTHVAHTHNHAHGPKHRKKVRHKPHSDDESDHHEDNHLSPFGQYPSALVDPATNFKDLLSHGVVVSVNGQPWNRIVAHVSDPDDEQDTEEHEEDAEWEDEPIAIATEAAGEGDEGVIKRRPRRARFGVSAGNAVKEEEKAVKRRRRPSEITKDRKIDRDRAVVVVYGLTPGKEYEIELQVVGLAGADGTDQIGEF